MSIHEDVLRTVTPEDLDGDLSLVAQECGLDVALRLHAGMAGCVVNVRKTAFQAALVRYVREHYDGKNSNVLAARCGLTERAIYSIVAKAPVKNDQHVLV